VTVEKVGGDAEVGYKAELLEHSADPGLDGMAGSAEVELAPLQPHGPTVGDNGAGEHLDQSALPGAVFPDQTVDLTEGPL
jgi:hypothetical protein